MRKKIIWGAVIIIALAAIVTFFSYLWAKKIPLTSLISLPKSASNNLPSDSIQVISWQPDQANLTYNEFGQIHTLQIKPLHPVVIVPIYEDGIMVREELALIPQSPHWLTAFCPNDTLEFEATDSGEIISIRNQGPRSCF